MSNKVVWFDVPVVDLARASAFYSQVLSVEINHEYEEVAVFEHQESEVAGCLVVDKQVQPSQDGVLLYYNVDGRLSEALLAVEKNGGSIIQAAHSIGPFGQRAIVLDSEGNRLALHSS